jgi:hypothetical protein
MSSGTTPIVATPPKDTIFGDDEPQDAIGHDVGKPTPSEATPIVSSPPQDTIFAHMGQGTPMDTYENRRRASRRHYSCRRHKNLYLGQIKLGTPLDTMLENRRLSSRRLQKMPHLPHVRDSTCHWKRRWKTEAERRDAAKGRHI